MKTTQLTFILFVLISLFTYSSCTKDGDIPDTVEDGTMTAKIDGQRFESKVAIGVIDPDEEGLFSIAGTKEENIDEANSGLGISFLYDPEIPIEEGTYNSSDLDCFNSDEICGFLFYIPENQSTSDPDEEISYISFGEDAVTNITITSIDHRIGGHVMGTFSGTLLYEDDEENITTVTITEGQFNVKIE
ncbi:MAG: hypothetical protein AB8B69_06030 [Chitinophagales bacterium]